MNECIVPAVCGLSTILVENVPLHSKHNPAAEALRYVDNLHYTNEPQYFILVECGLCYIIAPLKKKFPKSKIISVHLSDFIAGNVQYKADFSWQPSQTMCLNDFLQTVIQDIEAEKVKIIEWRPSLQVYAEKYLNTLSVIVRFIKQSDANKRTLNGFGKKWFMNVIRNCLLITNVINIKPVTRNCIVAAAGVSLEKNIEKVREAKQSGCAFVIAVSSAAPFLFHAGVKPDIIITTDGGSWALCHLDDVQRCLTQTNPVPLAFSLNAALPSFVSTLPLIPISDGSLWQNIVLSALGIRFLSFPQRGTVSAAALDLAFILTRGNIFLTGIDFSNDDIKTHCGCYSFDTIFRNSSCRLNPYYDKKFKRCKVTGNSLQYSIYRNWFNDNIYTKKNVYSIDDLVINNMNTGNINYTTTKINGHKNTSIITNVTKSLLEALSLPETKEQINKELSALSFNTILDDERRAIKNEILKLTEKYLGMETMYG
ncbi:hypothetical protein FACS1894190_01160 [Spirochaetia bacterium]|nr:hypothetical protein FACS1894190_01160 [Spirochaetia bacterium]